MIGYIKGRVAGVFNTGKSSAQVVLLPFEEDKLGVGYSIIVSPELSQSLSLNSVATLWTYGVQTENESYLIGLENKESVELFLFLISVSGVGPKSAMTILAKIPVDQVWEALREQNVDVFSKVPGIGKKTAAKIVLELSGRDFNVKGVIEQKQSDMSIFNDVMATLIKLGYTQAHAKEALQRARSTLLANPTATTAERVKLVLAHT